MFQKCKQLTALGSNSYTHIKDFFTKCIKILSRGKGVDEAIAEIIKSREFGYLKVDTAKEDITSAEFSTERKSTIFIKDALTSALRCKLCNGLIHQNSITFDHIIRKKDGGTGTIDNGQITHPYCNSTMKN